MNKIGAQDSNDLYSNRNDREDNQIKHNSLIKCGRVE